MNLLEMTELSKSYGAKHALQNLTLTIPRGKIIGLLGPNGSGKTTLIKLINGLLTPTSGSILINGIKPNHLTKKVVSYLPDCNSLPDYMTVNSAISYFKDFFKDFNVEKALKMLVDLNINPKSRFKTLSKGTKEKVQLILVMSREADLYLLDEPIGGVDPAARDYILNTIIGNYNPNATVIISTHLIADIENVLDEAIFIKDGHLQLYNSVAAIKAEKGVSVDALFREVYKC